MKNVIQYNFSVVVPCFNTGDTLCETIDSILAQSLSNVQIIIVDDASTDKATKNKINKYKGIVEIITLQKNGGLSHARNTGINHAKASLILCLDSDDKIGDSYLEKAKKIFDIDDCVAIVSPGLESFGSSQKRWIPSDKFSLEELITVNRIPVASCVRKSVYEIVGLYDEELKVYEDWDLWIRIFASRQNWRMSVIPEYLFFYRVQKNSMMHSLNEDIMKKAVIMIMKKHEDLYSKNFIQIFSDIHTNLMQCKVQKKIMVNTMQTTPLVAVITKFKKSIFPNKW